METGKCFWWQSGILSWPAIPITSVSRLKTMAGQDIYVAVDSPKHPLQNILTALSPMSLIRGVAHSDGGHAGGMGVVADDCDGWFDIFKNQLADDTRNLYHNNGVGTFTDVVPSGRSQQPLSHMGVCHL
jgi:hypothetical protein